MKVAFVHTYSASADAERHESSLNLRDRALATFLAEYRPEWQIHGVGCTEGDSPVDVDVEDDFMSWRWLSLDPEQGDRARGQRTSQALVSAVRDLRPDVIFVKGIGTPLAAAIAEAAPSARLIGVVGGRFRYPAYHGLSLALTETPEQDVYLRRRLGSEAILRLPKLVEADYFASSHKTQQMLHDAVCVGGFSPSKNQASLLALRHSAVRLAFVGDGPNREAIEALFAGGSADVTFYGNLTKAAVADVMRASRLLVHPSLSEGLPRVVAEAMAVGLPVLAVRGVVGEPVRHEVNGLLVRADVIPRVLMDMLAQRSLIARLGAAARVTAEEQFSVDRLRRSALEIAAHVETLVSGQQSRPSGPRALWQRSDAAAASASGAVRKLRSVARKSVALSERAPRRTTQNVDGQSSASRPS